MALAVLQSVAGEAGWAASWSVSNQRKGTCDINGQKWSYQRRDWLCGGGVSTMWWRTQ